MTLAQAQKQFDDAIEMKMEHASGKMTFDEAVKIGEKLFGPDKPAKVLHCYVGVKKTTVIVSHDAHVEEQRQWSMIPGTIVEMLGAEIEVTPEYKGKEWTVYAGPKVICGEVCVWIEGFSGAYSCSLLKIVKPVTAE